MAEDEASSTQPGWRSFLDPTRPDFWIGLIGIGILLRLIGSLVSALHVDTHMHAAYAINFVENGAFQLDWGPSRNPFFPEASDPSGIGSDVGWAYAVWHLWLAGWIGVFGRSPAVLHVSSLCISALLLWTTWKLTKSRFGQPAALRMTALVAIHPSLVAASVTGLQEEAIALLILLGCAAVLSGLDQVRSERFPAWWAAMLPLALALSMIKGLGTTIPLLGAVVAILWLMVERGHGASTGLLRQRPLVVLGCLAAFIWAGLLIPAWLDPTPGWSLTWVTSNPWPFFQAILFTLLMFGLLWGGVGLVAWPHARDLWARMTRGDLPAGALHMMFFVGLSFCVIVLFNSSFWAHEGFLLGMSVAETGILYWRNGRYISLLLIPFQWLLLLLALRAARTEEGEKAPTTSGEEAYTLGARPKALLITAMILIPMAVLVLFIDQHQAEDTSEAVGAVLEDGGEFLLITPPKAGMHRLYEHHMGVDSGLERGILGHWRADTHDWQGELSGCSQVNESAGNLSGVDVVVIDDAVDAGMAAGWTQITEGVAPGWRVFTWGGSGERCAS